MNDLNSYDILMITILINLVLIVIIAGCFICRNKEKQKRKVYVLILTAVLIITSGIVIVGFNIFNEKVKYELDSDKAVNIEVVAYDKSYLITDVKEVDEIIELFNNIKNIKRNPECRTVGTPDNYVIIRLMDGGSISIINVADERILVQLNMDERKDEQSMYFGTQEQLYKIIETGQTGVSAP